MELTLDEALRRGVEAHQAGRLQEAEGYYTAILNGDPRHPDANHNMGILAAGVGKLDEALPFFKMAIDVNSGIEQFWVSYINTLLNLNKTDNAKTAIDEARGLGISCERFDQFESIVNQDRVGELVLSL